MGLSRTVITQYIEKLQRILTESSFCVCIQNFVNLHIPKDPKSRNAACISNSSLQKANLSLQPPKKYFFSSEKEENYLSKEG